jgi:pimeloyl-ACP methyl ester carboxylesterase
MDRAALDEHGARHQHADVDPALIDALACGRRVVAFDNTGVGGSTGTTPSTITQMAHDAIAFLEALELDTCAPASG